MFKKSKTGGAGDVSEDSGKQKPVTSAKKAGKKLSGSKIKTRSIASFLMSVMMVVALVMLSVAAASFVLQQQKQASLAQAYSRISAEAVAERIADYLFAVQGSLKILANNALLMEKLARQETETLQQYVDQLARPLTDIKQIRVLPPGFNETDRESRWPLNYASLDLIHRAEMTERPIAAEVHALSTPSRHIAMAVAIRNDQGKVVGVIHIALAMTYLDRVLGSVPDQAGGLVLQQVVNNKTVELFHSPAWDASVKPLESVPVPGSIWAIGWQPVNSAAFSDLLMIPGLLLIGVLLVLVVVWLTVRKLRVALKTDQDALLQVIENKLDGKDRQVIADAALLENKEILSVLTQMSLMPAKKAAERQAVAASTERTEAIDSADTTKNDEDRDNAADNAQLRADIPEAIFRHYDIRGIVGDTLTTSTARLIGQATGSLVKDKGEQTVVVARDGRQSSDDMAEAVIQGLLDSGRDVIDIGMVPTPVLYFATHFLPATSGIMVTGSHNPVNYNGFKIVVAGESLTREELASLRTRIQANDLASGEGSREERDVLPDYLNRITGDIQLMQPMKVVVDCGNGVAGVSALPLLQSLGCEVIPLYCDVDGTFPNHHPDPSKPENMRELVEAVRENQAEIGLAFDGDGDRIGVVDAEGNIIRADRLLMLLAADVLIRNPGTDVIYDVKSSKHLATHILSTGGRPIMWKSGHTLMKAKLRETGALIAGELSGHIFFGERWYGFDDALYTGMRLLEVLTGDGRSSSAIFAELPDSVNTPELHLQLEEGQQYEVMEKLSAGQFFAGAKIIDIDGIRAEYPRGWGLVRASNTTPSLVFRFESDTDEGVKQIQAAFRQALESVLPGIDLPF